MSAAKKRGLGRGLDALLGPKGAVTPVTVAAVAEPQPGEVLRKLPIDGLKIDRSFVAGLEQEPGDAAITRAIISLANSLNLAVTAEGIEEPYQLSFLREQGCPFGQGYWYCRPMDVARLEDWLSTKSL